MLLFMSIYLSMRTCPPHKAGARTWQLVPAEFALLSNEHQSCSPRRVVIHIKTSSVLESMEDLDP